MKKIPLILLFIFINFFVYSQNLLKGKDANISFFSSTPLEDISANNKFVALVLKPSTGDIQISAQNRGFSFEKPLMQEHFNENYMESEKFPQSTFSGKISETVDYSKDATNNVTVKGKLTIHGVTKEVEISGKITVTKGKPAIYAKFPIKVADYGIKVPTLVVQKIAESVDVTISSDLEPLSAGKK